MTWKRRRLQDHEYDKLAETYRTMNDKRIRPEEKDYDMNILKYQ